MLWIKHSTERDWFTKDRIYLIKVEISDCTLFFEGKSIGRYTSEISAKNAAERYDEIRNRSLSGQKLNRNYDSIENNETHEMDRFWDDQNSFHND